MQYSVAIFGVLIFKETFSIILKLYQNNENISTSTIYNYNRWSQFTFVQTESVVINSPLDKKTISNDEVAVFNL